MHGMKLTGPAEQSGGQHQPRQAQIAAHLAAAAQAAAPVAAAVAAAPQDLVEAVSAHPKKAVSESDLACFRQQRHWAWDAMLPVCLHIHHAHIDLLPV